MNKEKKFYERIYRLGYMSGACCGFCIGLLCKVSPIGKYLLVTVYPVSAVLLIVFHRKYRKEIEKMKKNNLDI